MKQSSSVFFGGTSVQKRKVSLKPVPYPPEQRPELGTLKVLLMLKCSTFCYVDTFSMSIDRIDTGKRCSSGYI